MCAHAVVAAGRGLVALLVLYAVVLAAGLWLRLRFAAVPRVSDPSGLAVPPDSPGPTILIPRIVGLVAGVAVALSYAARPDVYQLWWSAVILLGFAAVFVCFRDPTRISPVARSRSSEVLLWVVAAAGVVLMLISHRPDADDAFYVNVAVAAADVPGRALLSEDTMHGIPGLPLYLPVYRVHSYELLNGALAYLSGIPAIYSFHWLSAAFAALLVPLAHAKLFRILSPQRWLATVATLVFVLVAVGETHRWYGNFSFVRMWQGKAIFLFVFTPLVYAYALRFALRPNLRDWAMLAMAQIAAVGCTSSALWAAPAGAVMALCSAVRPSRHGLKTVVLGALASVYVLAAAWLVRRSLDGTSTGSLSQGGQHATPQLHGALVTNALVTVLGDSRLLTFGILALLTGWVFAPPGLSRRFALVFPLGVLLGLLNPSIADWVATNVTGSTYWRSMWALPLPIVMALMLTWPLHLGGGWSRPGDAIRRLGGPAGGLRAPGSPIQWSQRRERRPADLAGPEGPGRGLPMGGRSKRERTPGITRGRSFGYRDVDRHVSSITSTPWLSATTCARRASRGAIAWPCSAFSTILNWSTPTPGSSRMVSSASSCGRCVW